MINQEILEYAKSLDRAAFIDNEFKAMAFFNEPLPIGHGQTISQPSLVVEMTQLLCPAADKRVLEIGTGSGYQTALLAHFSHSVYTLERMPELAARARERLDSLGYTNIHYRTGDGSEGWIEHAPYDRIIVTAAAGIIPKELVGQLAVGGIMVVPVGPRSMQELLKISKNRDGSIQTRSIEWVRFVEMIGKYGWSGSGGD